MARLARLVVPGLPHHVTQRGNRRERVFFEDDDYRAYLALIVAAANKAGTEIWSYCLMPNHVHFILAPAFASGPRETFAEGAGAIQPASTPASNGPDTCGRGDLTAW